MPVKLYDDHLASQGLGLQGVVNTCRISVAPEISAYRQLLVFAHTGGLMWRKLDTTDPDPLDSKSVKLAHDFMARIGVGDYNIVYPVDQFAIDLVSVGRHLGWHHDSRMAIGINRNYGTWFAYRFVIAASTEFAETTVSDDHPCDACTGKPCISACPAGAVTEGIFDLDRCATERLQDNSDCALSCAARLACPAGAEYRYTAEQIRYHYGRSLITLKAYEVSTSR